MSYALHFPNRGDLSAELLQNAVRFYKALKCRAMVIHRPMFERFQRTLLSHDKTLCLAVENHRLSIGEFQHWAESNQWLTLDVEHVWKFTLGGGPLAALIDFVGQFLSQFADKLAHVHLPGYVPGYKEHRPMYCNRDLVFGVMSLLEEYAFSGLVVSEVDVEYQNAAELQMDVLLFHRYCETNGL